MCPVALMHKYLALRGLTSGSLFLNSSGQPVTRSHFTHILRAALSFCGFPASIKSHSFHIGAATHAAALGFSDSQIRSLGRWHSNAFLRYIR